MVRLGHRIRAATSALLVVALVVAASGVDPRPARAADDATAEQAADFIRDLSQAAIAKLGDKSISYDARVSNFRALLEEGFAMDAISRFVLGRYWRVASDQEKQRFRDTFEQVLVQRFLPLFEGYSSNDFVIDGTRTDPRHPSLILVQTRIARPGNRDGAMVQAGWRVRGNSSGYEIVDVQAEGVSMAITLRSEYGSFIQRNGGSVSALIDMLQGKLESGAFEPATEQGAQ